MVRAKLNVRTCTTRRRPIPARGPSGSDGRVKPRRDLRYRRSLIYKLPVLRWPGTTARYSYFNVPVETGTPPRRRKVRLAPFPPDGETCARSLAAPLQTRPASLGSGLGRGSAPQIRSADRTAPTPGPRWHPCCSTYIPPKGPAGGGWGSGPQPPDIGHTGRCSPG